MDVIISNGLAYQRKGNELLKLSLSECATEIDRLKREVTTLRSTLSGIRWDCAVALDPSVATRVITAAVEQPLDASNTGKPHENTTEG